MQDHAPRIVPLRHGQSLMIFVECDTHIVAQSGTVCIEAVPGDFPGTFRMLLQEGEAQLTKCSGWMRLATPSGAQLVLAPPLQMHTSLPMRIVRFLRRMLPAMRHT